MRALDQMTQGAFVFQAAYHPLCIQADMVYRHLQGIPRLRPFHKDRAGNRVDPVPIQLLHLILRLPQLIGEAIQGLNIQGDRGGYA